VHQALADLATLTETSKQRTKEMEAEKAQLRADLARARIECEQLRGKVGELENEMYNYKMQVEQDSISRGVIDTEHLKKQLLTLRADLLANRADLLAQRELAQNAEVEKEALKMGESRLNAQLAESAGLLADLQRECVKQHDELSKKEMEMHKMREEMANLNAEAERSKGQLQEVRMQVTAEIYTLIYIGVYMHLCMYVGR